MTPAPPRITENTAASRRSRGRLVCCVCALLAAVDLLASEEGVRLIDFSPMYFCCSLPNAIAFTAFFFLFTIKRKKNLFSPSSVSFDSKERSTK
ncbi:hypothetical protein L227DRAFT_358990 [Lentinus tigrinus ALCF2SS1-6]|uniref:Uncharacterized protein n=1 Tax=Lentinus tigrinus ALCF2SS1-6 TaxID=1328759 RepID=A0A5C2SKC2_9APHY|nr:hypothetical protein L227DRAFT_358990 [Lentinus tigrinus ALCF2SS1-6]